MKDLNLDLLYPYLKDYINVGEMKGTIQTHLLLGGNLNEPDAVAANGTLALGTFHYRSKQGTPYRYWFFHDCPRYVERTKSDLYNFGSISLVEPFLKFERFEKKPISVDCKLLIVRFH